MVKRRWKYAFGAVLLMVGVAVAGCYWLLATTPGARWLTAELMRRSPIPVAVERVEGRLCDELRLQGAQVEWPGGSLATETLQFAWRPAALLRGKLLLSAVKVKGVNLVTTVVEEPSTAPRQPLSLNWPELPVWTRWLNIELHRLQLEAMQWQRPDQPPLMLERFAGRLHWTGSRLHLTISEMVTPQGSLQATLEARWGAPHLTLQAVAELTEQVGLAASLQLSMQLKPGKEEGALEGQLRLEATSEPTGKLTLASGLQLDAGQLLLSDFELAQTERAGRATGHARLIYGTDEPQLELRTELSQLDLGEIANLSSDLNGTLQLTGWIDDYRGRLDLSNRGDGWQQLQLAGSFAGNLQQIVFSQMQAQALEGRIGGELAVTWQPLLEVRGTLAAEGLDPGILRPDWPGTVAFQAEGYWRRPAEGPVEAALQGRLLDSTLRGYRLHGKVDGRLQGDALELAALELQGPGVSLNAKGALQRRIDLRFQAGDLAKLLPEADGMLQGRGWVRWRNQELAGALSGSGSRLSYGKYRLTSAKFDLSRQGGRGDANLSLDLRGLQGIGLPPVDVNFQGSGLPESHRLEAALQLDPSARFSLALVGGYREGGWKGILQKLMLKDAIGPLKSVKAAPLTLSGSAVKVQDLSLQGTGGEELQIAADLNWQTFSGNLEAAWRKLNLARADRWLPKVRITGRSSGAAELTWPLAGGERQVAARLELAGRLQYETTTVGLRRLNGQLNWNRSGLHGDVAGELTAGGRFQSRFESGEIPALVLPQKGRWQLEWQDFDLQPWLTDLPAGLNVEGRVSGSSRGSWTPGGRIAMTGQGALAGGRLASTTGDGVLSFELQSATVSWDWQEEQLNGTISMVLAEYGRLDGNFRLPVPASLPLAPQPGGALFGKLTGQMRELGLVALLLPGVVQESRGQVSVDATVGGVWRQPVFSGRLKVSEAGGYLPAAGIELKDLGATVELADDRLQLSEVMVRSGPGQLRGSGSARLQDWRLAEYQARLDGEKFQAVNLPELQAQVDPDLRFEGTLSGLRIDGRIAIDEFLLRELDTSSTVQISEDVVLVNAEADQAESTEPFSVTANIDLILGKHVLVKAAGLDARLEGMMKLQMVPGKDPTGNGQISVAEGAYSAYGAKLDIERGNLLFSGGPVQDPTLDILALRTVGKVKAGVRVAGTPRAPKLELYSEPPMGNNDRLAYIVLGRPAAKTSGDADLLMTAAGALLSQGESVVLQDQLKRQLGVDVLGFEAGEGDVTASLLTVGKYLNPDLYISYGRSLFTETSEFRMRYSLGKHWELESKTGTESGVDLYYKIEFR